MSQYLTYFKIKFISGLQYRSAALAGLSTQFFFGLVFIMVYHAFYTSGSGKLPMEYSALVSYLWLGQAFYALTYLYHREKDVINMIKNGDVAYELCKPGNLYLKWFFKIFGSKLSSVFLRFAPVILVAIILPINFRLTSPVSLYSFIGFILTLILGSFLITAITTLLHILTFYTIDAEGVLNFFRVIAELFAGAIVPIPFLPKFLQTISNYLPFQYISDVPFRIYVGNISSNMILNTLLIQFIWFIIISIIGIFLTKKALKKVIVQGG